MDQGINTSKKDSLVSNQSSESLFTSHPQRRAVFCIYFMQNLFCGFLYLSFKQIKESISYSYDVPVQYQRFASPMFMIGKFVGILFSYWVCRKLGLKKSNMLGNIIMIIGCIVRFGIFISFLYVFVGQFIIGFGTSIILIQNIQFVYNWFNESERKYFYAILLVAYQIGISIGITYSTLVVETKPRIIELTQNEINEFNVHILMMGFVILILSHFFFGETPPKKFGHNSNQYNNIQKYNMDKNVFKRFKNLITNKQFVYFLIIYSLKCMIEACLTNSFKPIFQLVNYPKSLPNYLNLLMWIVGTLGSFFYFRFLFNINDRLFFSFYSILQTILFAIGTICVFLLYNYLYFTFLFIGSAFFGFIAIPLIYEKVVKNFMIEDLNFINSIFLAFQIIFSLFGYYFIEISKLIFENKKDANFMAQCFITFSMFLLAVFAIKIE